MDGLSAILTALSPAMTGMLLAVTAVLSYLLGTCNGAILVSKFFLGDDVRKHGSGNGGLTNFQRTYGGNKLTLVVIAVDVVKVILAVWLSLLLFSAAMSPDTPPVFVRYWSGLFCVVGHVFPCTLHFKGGKGILTGGTLAFLVDWRVAAVAWGLFLLAVIFTRWVSLGSVLAAVAFGVTAPILYPLPSIIIPAIFVAVLILWKHRSNIKRLLRGEESKLSFRKKAEP